MSWLLRGRRAVSWREQTLESVSSPPPMPLIVLFGVVMLLMCLASYSDYRAQAQRAMISFKLLLFLLPVLLILFMHLTMVFKRWFYYMGLGGARSSSRLGYNYGPLPWWSSSIHGDGSSPWGLALVVLMLLVLVYYHSSVQYIWFRHVWSITLFLNSCFIIYARTPPHLAVYNSRFRGRKYTRSLGGGCLHCQYFQQKIVHLQLITYCMKLM